MAWKRAITALGIASGRTVPTESFQSAVREAARGNPTVARELRWLVLTQRPQVQQAAVFDAAFGAHLDVLDAAVRLESSSESLSGVESERVADALCDAVDVLGECRVAMCGVRPAVWRRLVDSLLRVRGTFPASDEIEAITTSALRGVISEADEGRISMSSQGLWRRLAAKATFVGAWEFALCVCKREGLSPGRLALAATNGLDLPAASGTWESCLRTSAGWAPYAPEGAALLASRGLRFISNSHRQAAEALRVAQHLVEAAERNGQSPLVISGAVAALMDGLRDTGGSWKAAALATTPLLGKPLFPSVAVSAVRALGEGFRWEQATRVAQLALDAKPSQNSAELGAALIYAQGYSAQWEAALRSASHFRRTESASMYPPAVVAALVAAMSHANPLCTWAAALRVVATTDVAAGIDTKTATYLVSLVANARQEDEVARLLRHPGVKVYGTLMIFASLGRLSDGGGGTTATEALATAFAEGRLLAAASARAYQPTIFVGMQEIRLALRHSCPATRASRLKVVVEKRVGRSRPLAEAFATALFREGRRGALPGISSTGREEDWLVLRPAVEKIRVALPTADAGNMLLRIAEAEGLSRGTVAKLILL